MLKGKTPLLVAVVLGLLAGLFAWQSVQSERRKARTGWELTEVLVAASEIPIGSVVSDEMVSRRPIPRKFVTSSVIKPENLSYVVGQKLVVSVQAGDPLLWSQLDSSAASEKLSSVIQKKGRAVTVDVSAKSSVGNWVRPNDHVDVIGTFRDPVSNEQMATTLLQNVIVLATGKITGATNMNILSDSQRNYGNVSLLVLPDEAEILVLAQTMGELNLALRNGEDIDVQEQHTTTTLKTLLSGEKTKALGEIRKKELGVTVIKGSRLEK